MKMFQDENPIPYEELYVGMEVRDNDGDCCVIKEILDPHNVLVEYTGTINQDSETIGGSGLHCLEKECKYEYDPLFRI